MSLSYVDKLKAHLAAAESLGKEEPVATTQEVVRQCLFEIEQMDQLNKVYFQRLENVMLAVDPGRIHDGKK